MYIYVCTCVHDTHYTHEHGHAACTTHTQQSEHGFGRMYSRDFPLVLQVEWLLVETFVALSLWVLHVILRRGLLSTSCAVPREADKELEPNP